MEIKKQIEAVIARNFNVCHLAIDDLSALHKGHKEARISGGGHYQILIVSDDFLGKNLITRHQLIHQSLKDLLLKSIHALGLKTYTEDEYKTKRAA